MDKKGLDYKAAGVDIDAANQSVEMIKKWVNATKRSEVMAGIGSFGGLFALDIKKYKEPVLVSGTDGVGTKLRIAHALGVNDTVGIDLVAMCVNDIIAHGAEPLFFLDYIALGKLKPDLVEAIVKGVSAGCLQAGCTLIGGETAEMPGFYKEDDYDLAGFAVGAVEKSAIIDGKHIKPGDVFIGLASSGLHSNGYSLARKVILESAGQSLETYIPDLGRTWGEELLIPTRIYVSSVLKLLSQVPVKGLAHITGGGILENLARILPEGISAEIETAKIVPPPVFQMIEKLGQIELAEMYRTFNMGVGYVIAVEELHCDKALKCLRGEGEKSIIIGKAVAGEKGVNIK